MTAAEIFSQLFSNRWPSPEELVKFAKTRHGYCGDDGYYGVTYPSDLDEYQKQVEGAFIPDGYIEVMYWDGDFKDIQVMEGEYLKALREHLLSLDRQSLLRELEGA